MGVYQEKIRAYGILPAHRNVAGIRDIILGERKAYVFLDKDFGDMHTQVKSCRRLDEEQACRLFQQVVLAVAHCHQAGIVLGDLKLRKFVFADEKRWGENFCLTWWLLIFVSKAYVLKVCMSFKNAILYTQVKYTQAIATSVTQ